MEMPVARAIASNFACFLLANAILAAARSNSEWTVWLFDLRAVPPVVRAIFLCLAGLSTLACAAGCSTHPLGRWLIAAGVTPILLIAFIDVVRYPWMLASGQLHSGSVFPFSLLVAGALSHVLFAVLRSRAPRQTTRFPRFCAAMLSLPVLLPLCQMWTFGLSDYRRPADAAIVFGAKVYADGSVSDVVSDRVGTACELYQTGLVHTLVFSGGPGDGVVPEADAMRAVAIARGVPPEACVVDYAGLNTRASLLDLRELVNERGWHSVLAVSHFYHLPRIKLLADRLGLEVFTVPVHQHFVHAGMPAWIAREAVAWWAYLLNVRT